MAYADDLVTARDNMAARLAEITADPKPSYSIDGQSVSWTDYQKFLLSGMEDLNNKINQTDPFEEISQGFT